MDLENLEQIPSASALGENAYVQKTEVVVTTEDDGYFGKPEKYDYSLVELPENYCYDDALLGEFNDLAGKYNLSQKGANELMSMAVKLTKLMSSNYSTALAEQHKQKIDNYRQMLVTDSEIGGINLPKAMHSANVAYSEFANEDVQKLLAETGLNCHPQIVKMFYNIGKKMQNDTLHGINAAAVVKENREDILFPTM